MRAIIILRPPQASHRTLLNYTPHRFRIMANHKSSIKRARQTVVRTERNRAQKQRIKTIRKKTISAIASGDKEAAVQSASELASTVDKAAKTNLFHPNKAANIKSKTAKALAALS